MSYRAPMNAGQGMGPSALRAMIRANPSAYFAGIRAARGAGLGMGPSELRTMIAKNPSRYFAGIRAARAGLGQAKTGATTPDHTATDWATALTTAGALAVPIVGAATGQQQATAPAATTLTAQAAPEPSTDWYWPVIGGVGVIMVGGIIYMVTKKPKTAAKVAANRRRSKKNGWRRKASRGLKGKRRSRSKRSY